MFSWFVTYRLGRWPVLLPTRDPTLITAHGQVVLALPPSRVHPELHVSFHWDGSIITYVSFSFSYSWYSSWDFVGPVSNQNIFFKMLWLHEKVLKILRARRGHSAALLADQSYFREQLVLITNTVLWFIGSWTKSLLCVCVSLASFPRPLHHSPSQVKMFFCHHCRFAVWVNKGLREECFCRRATTVWWSHACIFCCCRVHYLHSSDS